MGQTGDEEMNTGMDGYEPLTFTPHMGDMIRDHYWTNLSQSGRIALWVGLMCVGGLMGGVVVFL